MRRAPAALALAGVVILGSAAPVPAAAASPSATPLPGAPEPASSATRASRHGRGDEVSAARKYFTDVVLVNQDGQEMRLYSDLMQDRIVVINPFFTSCRGVCPAMMQGLLEIQRWLGDRLGNDVTMISISVDPLTDTPDVIKAYAESYGAKPGWYFLTGEKETVDWVHYKLGQYVEDKETHTSIILLGNLRTGLWKKVLGIADPAEIIRLVQEVVDDQG